MVGHFASGVRDFAANDRLCKALGMRMNFTLHSPFRTAISHTEVIPLQVSQRVSRLLPSTLVSPFATEPAVEPPCFVITKEHPVYLHRGTTTVLVSLVS